MQQDKSENKQSFHLRLKSELVESSAALEKFKKSDLHILCLAYSLQIQKSKTNSEIIEKLSEKVSACEAIPEPQHLIRPETDKRNKESEISSARNIEETKSLENPQSLDILENPEPSDVLENPQPGPSGMHLQSVHVQDDEHNEQSDMSLLTVLESNTDLSNVASVDPIQEESQADQQATSKDGKISTGKGKGRGKGKKKRKKLRMMHVEFVRAVKIGFVVMNAYGKRYQLKKRDTFVQCAIKCFVYLGGARNAQCIVI